LKIYKINETMMRIDADQDVLMKLHENFSYFVDGYKFSPKYKIGIWDGKVNLFRFVNRQLPIGFKTQLIEFCEDIQEEYEFIDFEDIEQVDLDYVRNFVSTLDLGEYKLRDYQEKIVLDGLNKQKTILISGTSSGKSLSQYILALHEVLVNKNRVLIIVPTTSLVLQMISDFKDYGLEKENVSIYGIQGGKRKIYEADVIVSTWQSIYLPENHPDLVKAEFGMVLTDEAHKTKDGKKLSDILFALKNTKYRIGVTGSLPKSVLERQQIIGVLGEPIEIINAKELIDRGLATQLDITAIFIEYSDEDRKYVRAIKNFAKETSYLNEHVKKQSFITKLALSQVDGGKNGIIFFDRTKYGKSLYERIKEKHDKTFFIDGKTNAEERERVRKLFEDEEGIILVASIKVFSTGINVKRVHFGIFGENPGKSFTTLVQSLGRFLRKHESKEIAKIFDIVDDLRSKSFQNYSYRHFLERLSHYRGERHLVKEKKFTLK